MRYVYLTLLTLTVVISTNGQSSSFSIPQNAKTRAVKHTLGISPITFSDIPKYLPVPVEDSVYRQIALTHTEIHRHEAGLSGSITSSLLHTILWLGDDKAVQDRSTWYVASDNVDVKARIVYPDGSHSTMDSLKILEATDQEHGKTLYYFAIDGLTRGCQLELLIESSVITEYTGEYIQAQQDIPIHDYEFLVHTTNGSTKLQTILLGSDLGLQEHESTAKRTDRWLFKTARLDPIEREYLSNLSSNRLTYGIKVSPQTSIGSFGIRTSNVVFFEDHQELIDALTWPLFTKAFTVSKFKSLAKKNGLILECSNENIRKIESFFKGFNPLEDMEEEKFSTIELLNSMKSSPFYELVACSKLLTLNSIEHQVLFTPGRNSPQPLKEFPIGENLNKSMIFIPALDLYIDPSDDQSRLSHIDPNLTGGNSLVISVDEEGQWHYQGLKELTAKSREFSVDSVYQSLDLSKTDVNSNGFHFRSLSGHFTYGVQSAYTNLSNEEITALNHELVETFSLDMNPDDIQVRNTGTSNIGLRPLQLLYHFEIRPFISEAGNDILLKVGKLIGYKDELYQEIDRQLPIEQNFNRTYKRKIEITIPEGYRVQNIEDLVFDAYDTRESGERYMTFTSTYTLNDNLLTIDINEFYDELILPVEKYPIFRDVINAAADFNKVVLVLEKETN